MLSPSQSDRPAVLEVWLFLLALTILLGALGQGALVGLGSLALTLGLVSWLWNRYALRRLSYQRLLSEERAFVGEEVEFTVEVTNRKPLPLAWLELEDRFPEPLELQGKALLPSHIPRVGYLRHLTAIRWYERLRWRYRIRCNRRGYHRLGPVRLRSGDLFGFFSAEERQEKVDHLLVYPQVVPLARLGFPSRQPFGEVKGQERLYEDPLRTIGVRDYHEGDSLKRIDWKATARRQALQSRMYEPTITLHLVVVLNIDTFVFSWEGTDPEALERAITVAASVASYAAEQRYAVGLLANGSLIEADRPIKILPSRHPGQLPQILEALAMITPLATTPFDRLLTVEALRLPWGATLVVISAVLTEGVLEALVRLRDEGYRVVLVSLGRSGPRVALPGITVYRVGEMLTSFGEGARAGALA